MFIGAAGSGCGRGFSMDSDYGGGVGSPTQAKRERIFIWSYLSATPLVLLILVNRNQGVRKGPSR